VNNEQAAGTWCATLVAVAIDTRKNVNAYHSPFLGYGLLIRKAIQKGNAIIEHRLT